MICPNCQKDSIPYLKLWLMSGYGTQRCSSCGATCRIRKSLPLRLCGAFLGALSAVIGLHFRSWLVFGVIFIVALVLSYLLDLRFRRLKLADTKNESCA